jgi:CO/xanthine dehydrogenase FAD-binding subunit
MTTAVEQYVVPQSVEEATEVLAGGDVSVFAGGTDLMVQARLGAKTLRPVLMNIGRIPKLRGIAVEGGEVRIGALTTVTELLESDAIRAAAPVLSRAADCFGSPQVRNAATIGGNLANASPAADLVPPLLVLEAQVDLASWADGGVVTRTVPLEAFFSGPGETVMRPGELLTFVRFPGPEPGTVAVFGKCGARPALDIAIVSVGIAGVKDNGSLRRVRVAFGAVAPTPIRGHKTEAALEGTSLDDEQIDAIARGACAEIAPISDVRASAWYRTRMIETMTRRLLHDVR